VHAHAHARAHAHANTFSVQVCVVWHTLARDQTPDSQDSIEYMEGERARARDAIARAQVLSGCGRGRGRGCGRGRGIQTHNSVHTEVYRQTPLSHTQTQKHG